ncbi:Beta-lactamase [Aspergillus sclerotialis]|uniref:Beta-lactamase n=1 Tax=Aspergillus sclerotialis TaxID=2070753 RepID=A0A3A2Z3M5_9EURO|nr:Beta-lactamase [Aspergillus sclerotialis]
MSTALPVREPYTEPIYSSLSFELFSIALSQKTGKSYDQLLTETILEPLGLKNTGASPGNDEKAVIPPLDKATQGWGTDYGFAAPGGGLYSSLGDLATLASRILDETVFQDPESTRQWLKPQSMTSGINELVGRPWEIQRTNNLVPENSHTIDIYAKSGGASGYVSQMSLVDEYGIGFVVLTAGPQDSPTASVLNDAVISSLIPAIDQETRKQAHIYTGNFSSGSLQKSMSNNGKTSAPVSLGLSIDNGTGLKIDPLVRNGSNILAGFGKLWNSLLPMIGILNSDFRLYPTGIENPVDGEKNVVLEDWRINFDIIPADNAAMSDLPGQGKLSNICTSWQSESWIYYGGEALDRIVFKVDRGAGKMIGVDIPFLRSGILEKA